LSSIYSGGFPPRRGDLRVANTALYHVGPPDSQHLGPAVGARVPRPRAHELRMTAAGAHVTQRARAANAVPLGGVAAFRAEWRRRDRRPEVSGSLVAREPPTTPLTEAQRERFLLFGHRAGVIKIVHRVHVRERSVTARTDGSGGCRCNHGVPFPSTITIPRGSRVVQLCLYSLGQFDACGQAIPHLGERRVRNAEVWSWSRLRGPRHYFYF
jgi:hypothetical protein